MRSSEKNNTYVANPFQSPAVLSFCTGLLRGLELGIERVIGKTRVAAYVEIEAFIIENILEGMQKGILDAAPVWTDAKTFPAKPFHKKICIITGGYPCQPFSYAGQRAGTDDPRHLYPYLSRSIAAIKPVCCFFENVSGHITMGFDEVYKDLRNLGYTVEAGLFTAAEVGASHERERLFILAISTCELQHWQQQQPGWIAELANRCAELADTGSQSGQPATTAGLDMERLLLDGRAGQQDTNRPEPLSKNVGNATIQRCGKTGFCITRYNAERATRSGEQKMEYPPCQRCSAPGNTENQKYTRPAEPCYQLAHPHLWRQQQWNDAGMGRQQKLDADRWPAGPGSGQYSWEHERIIEKEAEPGLGLSAHGYRFREDILRGLGNGVVKQQAAKAFATLLLKHLDNIKK